MEQVSLFLAEYSDWMGVAFGVFVTILLTATLRRIKKLGKRMDALTYGLRFGREDWAGFDERERGKKRAGKKSASQRRMDEGKEAVSQRVSEEKSAFQRRIDEENLAVRRNAEKGSPISRQGGIREMPGESKREMNPDELLNAVLDEVFP